MSDIGARIAACKREIRTRSQDGVERRWHPTALEVREAGAGWQIGGYGIVYNSLSENLGGFREQVAPGAAEGLLTDPDIWGLFNHNPDLPLGRTGAGTMTLEDHADRGVDYTIDPPDTSYANDLRVSIGRGDVTRSSFAFRVARGGDVWEEDPDTGLLIRTVVKFSNLYDFSPVTYAAYLGTSTGVRATSGRTECVACNVFITPSPDAERGSDGPSQERATDGGTEEAGGASEALTVEQTRQRLRLRGARLRA